MSDIAAYAQYVPSSTSTARRKVAYTQHQRREQPLRTGEAVQHRSRWRNTASGPGTAP